MSVSLLNVMMHDKVRALADELDVNADTPEEATKQRDAFYRLVQAAAQFYSSRGGSFAQLYGWEWLLQAADERVQSAVEADTASSEFYNKEFARLHTECDTMLAFARRHCIVSVAISTTTSGGNVYGYICNECLSSWYGKTPETHKPGCLAVEGKRE